MEDKETRHAKSKSVCAYLSVCLSLLSVCVLFLCHSACAKARKCKSALARARVRVHVRVFGRIFVYLYARTRVHTHASLLDVCVWCVRACL